MHKILVLLDEMAGTLNASYVVIIECQHPGLYKFSNYFAGKQNKIGKKYFPWKHMYLKMSTGVKISTLGRKWGGAEVVGGTQFLWSLNLMSFCSF